MQISKKRTHSSEYLESLYMFWICFATCTEKRFEEEFKVKQEN